MAEDTPTTETPAPAAPALDEAKIAELIKASQQESIKTALAAQQAQQLATQQPQEAPPERDVWDDILEPKLARERQRADQAGFIGAAANDKADFYSGEFWEDEVASWLPHEDEAELKTAKRELRKKIEDQFDKLAREGRALPRADIAKHQLMEHLTENKTKFHESTEKKRKQKETVELDKAKRGVDIQAGTMFSMDVAELESMPFEKIHEKYGKVPF